eukprot:TRINITY_DN18736_c0_g1_i1.p1 TRINITY_DN18736_c0_g1~~TRINITY_DN18736_c0_g1_i1.p1  ORF type:complete len:235 (+),score=5.88 TRINITY_DN18736_c0_g1_i1:57-707(+)
MSRSAINSIGAFFSYEACVRISIEKLERNFRTVLYGAWEARMLFCVDVLHIILRFLDPRDRVATFSVCKRWREVALEVGVGTVYKLTQVQQNRWLVAGVLPLTFDDLVALIPGVRQDGCWELQMGSVKHVITHDVPPELAQLRKQCRFEIRRTTVKVGEGLPTKVGEELPDYPEVFFCVDEQRTSVDELISRAKQRTSLDDTSLEETESTASIEST